MESNIKNAQQKKPKNETGGNSKITIKLSSFGNSESNNLLGLSELFKDILNRLLTQFQAELKKVFEPGIFDEKKNLLEREEEIIKEFNDSNWPISPSMSKHFILNTLDFYKQGKKSKVSNKILGHYQKNNFNNLKEIVKSWESNSLYSERMEIFNNALIAHCEKKYILSVPALFPQIEGILNDYIYKNNIDTDIGRITKVYKKSIGDFNEYTIRNWIIAKTLFFQFDTNIYPKTSFEKELNKTPKTRIINRHTVLHGVSYNFNKPSISLKLFLLLDSLKILREFNDQIDS